MLYGVSGTATPGADYVALPGAITIPAGAASETIAISPLDDPFAEPNEMVSLTLNADPAYTAGSPARRW